MEKIALPESWASVAEPRSSSSRSPILAGRSICRRGGMRALALPRRMTYPRLRGLVLWAVLGACAGNASSPAPVGARMASPAGAPPAGSATSSSVDDAVAEIHSLSQRFTARRALIDRDEAVATLAWLGSRNPSLRQAALLYGRDHAVVGTATLAMALAALDDREPRPVGVRCLELVGHDLPPINVVLVEQSTCENTMKSNAELAPPVIEQLARGLPPSERSAGCAQLLARVEARSEDAAALQRSVNIACQDDEIVQLAITHSQPVAQHALLSLALRGEARLRGAALGMVGPLLQSPEQRTRELAAALVLRATAPPVACCTPSEPLDPAVVAEAVRVATGCIADTHCATILPDLAAIAGDNGASLLVPALMRRLRQPGARDPQLTLAILAAVEPTPTGTAAHIERMLDASDEALANRALEAAAAVDRDVARAVKPAILRRIGRWGGRHEVVHQGVDLGLALRALKRMDRPLALWEFRAIWAVYRAGCPTGEGDALTAPPYAAWCQLAEQLLGELTLEHGL